MCSFFAAGLTAAVIFYADGTGRTDGNKNTATPAVWFTQIGRWHYVRDSVNGKYGVFHDASRDGAQSGVAVSDLKYNKTLPLPSEIKVALSVDGNSSCAGVVLKSHTLAYYFMLDCGEAKKNDSLKIFRCLGKKRAFLAGKASASGTDIQHLSIKIIADSVTLTSNNTELTINKPADLPDSVTVGLACFKGSVYVWEITVKTPSAIIKENFVSATVVNLGLERIFAGNKYKKK